MLLSIRGLKFYENIYISTIQHSLQIDPISAATIPIVLMPGNAFSAEAVLGGADRRALITGI